MDLVVINHNLQEIKNHIGAGNGPLVVTDDREKQAAAENVLALKGLEKAVDEYFQPLIDPLRSELDTIYASKREWVESIRAMVKLLNDGITAYNNIERERLTAKRLEEAKLIAEKTGQDAPDYIPETRVVSRNEFMTSSESPCIDEIQITDTLMVIDWAITSGLGMILKLDKTVETALKKYLVDNPKISAVPGLYFKRGFKQNVRGRK